jgi:putative transposase
MIGFKCGCKRMSFCALWQTGVKQFDELSGIDWDWLSMDGAMRHLLRWAGKKPDPIPTSRGKSGEKRSVLTEGHGVPIGVTIEGANRHAMKLVRPTIESIVIERASTDRGAAAGDVSGVML